MNSKSVRFILCALVAAAFGNGSTVQAARVFGDTFETGTNGAAVGAPWGLNNLTAAIYSNVSTPFPDGGNVYLDINDASASAGIRLFTNAGNNNGLVSSLDAQITTYSFEFYEPTRTGDVNSLIFGYYRQQANPDLNMAGRIYSSTLREGNLSPQGPVLAGGAVTYLLDTVNTVYMFANDTETPEANYAGTGLELAATSADVWISRGGNAPEYAFTVDRQNVGTTAISGVGFRTNNADIERFSIDNVLVSTGATFDRSSLFAFPNFEVDRDSGIIRMKNTSAFPVTVKGYTLSSAAGALKPGDWDSIADTGDADSGAPAQKFDATGIWLESASLTTQLSESTTGSGGTLAANTGVRSLGDAWARTPYQDLVANYVLSDGSSGSVAVTYIGEALDRSDLNSDGALTAADFSIFTANSGASFAGQTRVQSYFGGDLDGDLDNDFGDFRLFKADYIAANGQSAFLALFTVPEPSALVIVAVGLAGLGCSRRLRQSVRVAPALICAAATFVNSANAATPVAYVASGDPGAAPDANIQTVDAWTTAPTAGSGSGFFNFPANGIPDNHWVLFSFPSGGISGTITADHAFDGGALSVGQAVRLDFANSSVAALGSVGVSLMSAGVPMATFKFNGGGTNYLFDDSSGVDQPLDVPFAFRSLSSLEFRIDSSTTYTAAYGNANGSTLWSGATTGDPIDGIRVFNAAGGNGSDVVFNNLTVGATTIVPLTLEVNKTNGEVKIKGNPSIAGSIDYYQITSAANALNFTPGTGANQWNSLDLQNLNAVDGTDVGLVAGDSPTEGWDAASNSTKGRLAEYFVRPGGSAVPIGGALSIGKAYDNSVFTSEDGDLVFSYGIAGSSRLMTGSVAYVTSAVLIGDYNSDGTVNAADYVVWRDHLGQTFTLPNRDPANGTGVISQADYSSWRGNFGTSAGSTAFSAAVSVPEPALASLLLLGISGSLARRPRRAYGNRLRLDRF